MSDARADKRRVRVKDLREGEIVIVGDAAHHLATVLRLAPGARVTAFDAGREAACAITSVADARVTLACGPVRAPAPGREIVLLYSLSKGDKVDLVVRDAAELGVSAIVVLAAERSVVKIADARADKKKERWARIAEEAARQCGRADVPTVSGPLAFADAITSVHVAHKFLLHPAANARLAELLPAALATDGGIALVVGPEGGFADDEIVTARTHGFTAASFGRTTLRTETVPAAVLGALAVWDE